MLWKLILNLLVAFSLCGCASYFKRKDCEAVNWYDYGQKLALSGRRLEADNFLIECRKVEAEVAETQLDLGYKSGRDRYCTMDEIYNVGKNGQTFNYELCDHLNRQKVKERHLEGLLVFCKPDNAYSFAAKGGLYEKVCPQDVEPAFLKEYNRGRKVYLQASIESNEIEINDIERDINKVEREKDYKMGQLSRIPIAPAVNSSNMQKTPNSGQQSQVVDVFKQERDRLENEVNSLSSQIKRLHDRRELLKDQNRKMRTEMVAL